MKKNRIAQIAALIVVLTAAFSFSQESFSEPTERYIVCDTVTQRIITDCIPSKKLKDVESFYSNSFKDIQSSYNIFLLYVGVLVAIGCAIFGILGAWNWWTANDTLKKARKKLKRLKKKDKKLFGEVEFTYFSLAIYSFKREDYKEHFRRLAEYFFIYTTRKLRPDFIDLKRLKSFDVFLNKYTGSDNEFELAEIFLYELHRFIKYVKKKYNKRNASTIELSYLVKIQEIWDKLCAKYGGEDRISAAIKNFNYEDYDYSL